MVAGIRAGDRDRLHTELRRAHADVGLGLAAVAPPLLRELAGELLGHPPRADDLGRLRRELDGRVRDLLPGLPPPVLDTLLTRVCRMPPPRRSGDQEPAARRRPGGHRRGGHRGAARPARPGPAPEARAEPRHAGTPRRTPEPTGRGQSDRPSAARSHRPPRDAPPARNADGQRAHHGGRPRPGPPPAGAGARRRAVGPMADLRANWWRGSGDALRGARRDPNPLSARRPS